MGRLTRRQHVSKLIGLKIPETWKVRKIGEGTRYEAFKITPDSKKYPKLVVKTYGSKYRRIYDDSKKIHKYARPEIKHYLESLDRMKEKGARVPKVFGFRTMVVEEEKFGRKRVPVIMEEYVGPIYHVGEEPKKISVRVLKDIIDFGNKTKWKKTGVFELEFGYSKKGIVFIDVHHGGKECSSLSEVIANSICQFVGYDDKLARKMKEIAIKEIKNKSLVREIKKLEI